MTIKSSGVMAIWFCTTWAEPGINHAEAGGGRGRGGLTVHRQDRCTQVMRFHEPS